MGWRRLDVPGVEESRVRRIPSGWHLTGVIHVEEASATARLHYTIECNESWLTHSAVIEGEVAGRPVRFVIAADGNGLWTRDGVSIPEVAGALDIDLGFTPATNMLPIRRLQLAIGETAPVRSAWLRFPELSFEPLEQAYTREAERRFRYHAMIDGEPFTAQLDIDAFGRVLRYEGLWEAKFSEPQ